MEAENALALQPQVDAPHFFALARAVRGWALAATGRHTEGAADLEAALQEQLAVDARPYAALTAALLAESYQDPAIAAASRRRRSSGCCPFRGRRATTSGHPTSCASKPKRASATDEAPTPSGS